MKDKFVLDLGCGDGALVRDLRQMKVNAVGVDLFLTPEMRRSHFIAADAFQLPFRSSSVDTILSIWSVFNYEPLFQIRPLLDQALSILKPRGRLFISAVHDPKKIQLIKDWCEKNHTHVFTALPGKALQLIKK